MPRKVPLYRFAGRGSTCRSSNARSNAVTAAMMMNAVQYRCAVGVLHRPCLYPTKTQSQNPCAMMLLGFHLARGA